METTTEQKAVAESSYIRGAQMNRNIGLIAGLRVRNIRENMHISRESLSKLTGVPRTTIKNYELNYRKADLEIVNRVSVLFPESCLNVLAYLSCVSDELNLEAVAEEYFKAHPEHVNMRINHTYPQQLCTCGHGRCM